MNIINKYLLEAIRDQEIGLINDFILKKPDLFHKDENGRTLLFDAVQTGNIKIVEMLIFSLMGTGMSLQRLALLEIEDNNGKTAQDHAAKNGFKEIEALLRSEKVRMTYYE